MKPVRALLVVFLGATIASAALAQGPSNASAASQASLAASGFVVAGSSELIRGSAQLTVVAVQTVGESVVIVLRGASEAGTVSVRTSETIARAASVAAGTSVRVVAESVGYALYVGAQLIAFVPNEIGRALIHQSVRDGAAKK